MVLFDIAEATLCSERTDATEDSKEVLSVSNGPTDVDACTVVGVTTETLIFDQTDARSPAWNVATTAVANEVCMLSEARPYIVVKAIGVTDRVSVQIVVGVIGNRWSLDIEASTLDAAASSVMMAGNRVVLDSTSMPYSVVSAAASSRYAFLSSFGSCLWQRQVKVKSLESFMQILVVVPSSVQPFAGEGHVISPSLLQVHFCSQY